MEFQATGEVLGRYAKLARLFQIASTANSTELDNLLALVEEHTDKGTMVHEFSDETQDFSGSEIGSISDRYFFPLERDSHFFGDEFEELTQSHTDPRLSKAFQRSLRKAPTGDNKSLECLLEID